MIVSMENKRLLYIEDHPINFKIMHKMVATIWKLNLRHAKTAEEGLQLIQHEEFDLVFMDLHLPGIQGLEAIEIIRDEAEFAQLPIIAVTADASPTTREAVEQAGGNGFTTKPVDMMLLKELVEEHCK